MKSKEEIDELYHNCWDDFINKYDDNLHYYSFLEGYTQCQEDMANKIKLVMDAGTFLKEFDSKIEFSMIDGGSIRANHGDILELMEQFAKLSYEQGLKDGYACMPSINSLNKQD